MPIASDLRVTFSTAGLLVTGYAIGVMVDAPVVTLATARVERRALLIGLMGLFTLGNLMAALPGGYGLLMAARLVTSLNHGAFFGVGAAVAAGLVSPERRAGAVAAMFSGLTLAMVVGLPLVAWAGSAVGWRTVFAAIAFLGAGVMLALRLALPRLPVIGGTDAAAELRMLGRGDVLLALALTTDGFGGMFTVFTYITPLLREATGVSTGFVTLMLGLFGVGATIANAVGGKLADRYVTRTLAAMLGLMLVVLVAFAGLMRWPVPTAGLIFLWGVASFATAPPLQMRVMAAAAGAPTLASAMNIGAFNLGNALGAALGGAVLNAGGGYSSVALAGAGMATAALGLLLLAIRWPPTAGTLAATPAGRCVTSRSERCKLLSAPRTRSCGHS